MSYDLRIGVKVEGAEDLYAVIDEPDNSSPTYNLGEMFRACTGWDFVQGNWYKVSEVLPLIEHGIHELRFNRLAYGKYAPENGFGSSSGALKVLESIVECIQNNTPDSCWTWNHIPLDLMYISW